MRCPTCNSDLPDGLVRCTVCNTALDGMPEPGVDPLWDDPPAPGVDLFTSAQGTQEQPAPHDTPQPAPYSPQGTPQAGQAAVHTRIVTMDPEQERGTRIVDVSVPQVARRAGRPGSPGPSRPGRKADQSPTELSRGVEDLFDGMKLGYARMHRVDRLSTWIGLIALVAAFLPWRYQLGDGLIAGIQGLGAASAAAFGLVLLCIFGRTARRRLTGLLLTLQILAASGGTAVPVFVFLSHGGTAAKFGLYITALGGAATIVMTLTRLAVKNF